MLPNFIIIGAQKAATTFIHQCLAEHPEVFMPPTETTYFEDPDYHQIQFEQFEDLFRKAINKNAVGIKRPSYLAKPECPTRIKKHIPTAKLIVVLRNPIERAVSAFFHNMKYGFIPLISIETGMEKLLDGEYKERYPRSQEIIEFGFYYKQLTAYLALFKREQILVLFHEDIKQNKLNKIKKVYNFLTIDNSYVPHQINSRPQAVVYSVPRLKLLTLRNHHLYTYNDERTRLYPKGQTLSDKIVCRVINTIDNRILARCFSNKKPILSDRLQQRLFSIYEQNIANLERLLNRKLPHWKP